MRGQNVTHAIVHLKLEFMSMFLKYFFVATWRRRIRNGQAGLGQWRSG